MLSKPSARTSRIQMLKVPIPSASLNACKQRCTCLRIGKTPNTKIAVFARLINARLRSGQRQQLHTHTGQRPHAVLNAVQKLLALLDRQCFPMCIGRIELDEIVRHGFLQRRLIEISQRSLTNAARGIGRAHLQPLGAKRTNPIRLVFTSIVEPVTDRVLHVIGRVSTQG